MGDAGIAAAHHPGHTADTTVNDVIVERAIGGTEQPAQQVVNRFVAEAGNHVGLLLGNAHVLAPIGIVIYHRSEDFLGRVHGVAFVELHMGGAFNMGSGVGGDNFGMVALGDLGQPLHDALDIDHHSLHRAGDDGQLLLQEIAGDGHAVTHQYLVGGAAHAGQIDPFGPLGLGIFDHFRVLRGHGQYFGQMRFVPVDDEVHLIVFEHSKVYLAEHWRWRAEEDILELGGNHAAPPAIGKGGFGPLAEQAVVILVNTHMGAVHGFYHLAVDAAGGHTFFAPDFLALQRRPLQEEQLSLLLAELVQQLFADFDGDFTVAAVADVDIKVKSQLEQLLLIF